MSASLVDFQAPFDPTAYSQISGAQLLELIIAAQPYIDKGLVVTTSDNAGVPIPPDAGTITKFQRYLWLRIVPNNSTIILYAWNPNGQANIAYSDGSSTTLLSNWISIISSAIPPASITGSLIAANTILPGNINLSLLATALGFNPSTTVTTGSAPTGGMVSGSFATGFTINAGTVTAAMLAALAITGAQIAPATIDYTKLIGDGTAGDMLKSTGTPNIAPIWFTPLQITTGLANPNNTGTDDGKAVVVNSGAAGTFKYVTLVLPVQQVKFASSTTSTSSVGNITDANNHVVGDTGMTAATGLSVAITPTSNTNYLIAEAVVSTQSPSNNNAYWAYLFVSGTAAPIAAVCIFANGASTLLEGQVTLKAKITTPGTTALTFSVYFGQATAGTGKVNGKSETSSIMVTEYNV